MILPLSVRRTLVGLVLVLAASLGVVAQARADVALPPGLPPLPFFPADPATLGAIPDGTDDTCGSPAGGVREVAFPVSETRVQLSVVSVSMTLRHDYLGDLTMLLIAPDGTTVTIIDRIGTTASDPCGEPSGMAGTFSFSDSQGVDLAARAATVPDDQRLTSGIFRAQAGTGPALSIAAPLVGHNPNGTWRLRIVDHTAEHTGDISTATLRITSTGRQGTQECIDATAASSAAQAARVAARARVKVVKGVLRRAERQGSEARVTTLKKRLRAAKRSAARTRLPMDAAIYAEYKACL